MQVERADVAVAGAGQRGSMATAIQAGGDTFRGFVEAWYARFSASCFVVEPSQRVDE